MTEQEKQKLAREFFDSVRSFPSEKERKQIIFDSLNNILQALGSYINDNEFSLTQKEVDGEKFIYLQTVYGTFKQSVAADSASAFFGDLLKLLILNVKEMDYAKSKLSKIIYSENGKKTSELKKKTSAENGKKGGRPKKTL